MNVIATETTSQEIATMEKCNACTIVSENYLPFARNLARSFLSHHPDRDFHILVVDENRPETYSGSHPYRIWNVDQLAIPKFREMAFQYDIVELNTAVKPFFLDWLCEKFGYHKLLYIDPDMMVFHPLVKLDMLLDEHSIVLTPHVLDSSASDGLLPARQFLLNGIYNLGFLGIQRDANSKAMLEWWKRKLADMCFLDYPEGLAVDQRWMDFTPALFDGVHILKDPGFNMAFWNMHERSLVEKDGICLVNGQDPLCLYHFSSFKMAEPEFIQPSKGSRLADRPDLKPVYENYFRGVREAGYDEYRDRRYAYSQFDDGVPILPFQRRLFFRLQGKGYFEGDPFQPGGEHSFQKFLSDQGFLVRENSVEPGGKETLSDVPNDRIRAVRGVLRAVRRILGLRRYLKLAKAVHWVTDVNKMYKLYQ
jgi:hypothetical protein